MSEAQRDYGLDRIRERFSTSGLPDKEIEDRIRRTGAKLGLRSIGAAVGMRRPPSFPVDAEGIRRSTVDHVGHPAGDFVLCASPTASRPAPPAVRTSK